MKKLTEKQKRFCDEYLIDMNATQSAIRSGYSKKTAKEIGCENLTKPNIKAYISQRLEEKENELVASQDEIMRYLTSVIRGQSESAEIVVEGVGQGMSIAKTIRKTPSEKDRLKASELLGKRYGMFTEKIESEMDMNINVTIDYGEEE